MSSARSATRVLWALVVAISASAMLAVVPAAATAAPWTSTYDWQGNGRTGYENWKTQEGLPDTGEPGPFYESWLGTAPSTVGRGIAFRPLGGRTYASLNPASPDGAPNVISRWSVPGASRITRVRFDDLRYRNEGDGQFLRVRVIAGGGTSPTEDFGPAFGETETDRTYSLPAQTQTPDGGGTAAEVWLFTACGTDLVCPTIPTTTGTFGRVGSTVLTLDDPDKPKVEVATSPDITDGWVNKKRAQRLRVSATDPSSGIERIRIQATNSQGGTGGATILNQPVVCDPLHRTEGRGGLNCPPTADASKTDPAGAQGPKGRTFTITATDDAGNVSDPVIRRIRYDGAKPTSASISGELERILNRWTNRRGEIPVTVRAGDPLSGVARIDLQAQRIAGGRAMSLGSTNVACDGNDCRTASVRLNADLDAIERNGRYRVQVRVTDRAGNVSKPIKVPGRLQIDREAPAAPTGYVQQAADGRWFAYLKPGRDKADSSGPGSFDVEYPTGPAQRATTRAKVEGQLTRTARGKFRKLPLPSYQPTEGADATVAQDDGALNPSGRVKLAVGPLKKLLCTVGDFVDPTGLVGLACKGFKDGINKVVKEICTGGGRAKRDQCAKAIEEICKKVGKFCGPVKKAACFLTELDQFCTPGQKRKKDADAAKAAKARLAAKIAKLRAGATQTIKGGTARSSQKLRGRDGQNRATENDSTGITSTTVDLQRANKSSGQTRRGRGQEHHDPAGWKRGCKGYVRGHLLPRILGGTGDGRNITLLSDAANQAFNNGIEKFVRELVADKPGVQLDVKVTANYQGKYPVPKSLTYTVVERNRKSGNVLKSRKGKGPRVSTIDVPDWDKVRDGCR